MKTELKLGSIITEPQQRDAIHIAVAPMKSAGTLSPGQHVGLSDGMATPMAETIGIVDPFLTHPVKPGQQFWLFLYPQTVTGMRHEWTHPAFSDNAPLSQPASQVANSEKWLEAYVRQHCPYWENKADGGYSEFLRYVKNDRWIYYNGSDCHSLGEVEDADELFRHLSIVLNCRIDASYFKAFTCSC